MLEIKEEFGLRFETQWGLLYFFCYEGEHKLMLNSDITNAEWDITDIAVQYQVIEDHGTLKIWTVDHDIYQCFKAQQGVDHDAIRFFLKRLGFENCDN